jgi:hypothetical protein
MRKVSSLFLMAKGTPLRIGNARRAISEAQKGKKFKLKPQDPMHS